MNRSKLGQIPKVTPPCETHVAGALSLNYTGRGHSTKLVIMINLTHRAGALSLNSVIRVTQPEFHIAGALGLN